MADIAAGFGPVWFLFSIALTASMPSKIRRPPLVAQGILWRILRPSWGHFVRYLFLMLLRAAAVCACSVVDCGVRAASATTGSGAVQRTTANRPTRLWAPTRGLRPPWRESAWLRPPGLCHRPLSCWGDRRADRRPSNPVAMQNGRLRAGQSMLRTRPRAGHRVISQVGCLRETRSDHPGPGRPAGYPGRGVASRPGIHGWSKPTSRRPAWMPVRDRWQRPLASGSRSWFVSRAARCPHVAGPLSLTRSPA
jgi:hypothetical protein